MNTILSEIAAAKREAVAFKKSHMPVGILREKIPLVTRQPFALTEVLSSKDGINIIAEIKRASPSVGWISQGVDPALIATRYARSGAAAISVLTEEKYFKGSLDDMIAVRRAVPVPVLRKDFIIDQYQIYETAAFGGDAILLIAALLDDGELKEFLALASSLELDALVEIHDEADLEKVEGLSFNLLGVNARNLKDFSIDTESAAQLINQAPRDKIIVAESGIKDRSDIELFTTLGVNAFLIGQTLMQSQNVETTFNELRRGLK